MNKVKRVLVQKIQNHILYRITIDKASVVNHNLWVSMQQSRALEHRSLSFPCAGCKLHQQEKLSLAISSLLNQTR